MVILARFALVTTAILLSFKVSEGLKRRDNISDVRLLIEWGSIFDPIIEWFLPPITEVKRNILFYLHTDLHCIPTVQPVACISKNDPCTSDPDACRYQFGKPIIFIIHGFRSSYSSDINTLIKNAILQKLPLTNVYIVDWSYYATNPIYVYARNIVPLVGQVLGQVISSLVFNYEVKPHMVKLIGHSLGAHVAGVAGNTVASLRGDKIDFIVGLDPAGFWYHADRVGLNPTSAEFVHAIHTDMNIFGADYYVGHADYYPNGGYNQPGCTKRKRGDVGNLFGCSHSRAYEYYAESIRSGYFLARQCFGWDEFIIGKCNSRRISRLPGMDVDRDASGKFYLYTNSRPPYAMGQSGIYPQLRTSSKKTKKIKRNRNRTTGLRKSIRRKITHQHRTRF